MATKENTLTIPSPRGRMQLAPVPIDDPSDELIKAIDEDPIGSADEQYWDLHDTIDPDKLDRFWERAVEELGAMQPEDAGK